MIIRNEQIAAFLPQTDDEIVEFIIEHLQEESPEHIDRLPHDSLKEMVRNGLQRSRRYPLQDLGNLNAFVSLMFEISPTFDEQEDINKVLKEKDIDKNFDRLFEPHLNSAWEAAANDYDADKWAKAWFPDLED